MNKEGFAVLNENILHLSQQLAALPVPRILQNFVVAAHFVAAVGRVGIVPVFLLGTAF